MTAAFIPREMWAAKPGSLIYFVGATGGPIKIGRTRNLPSRHKQLQCCATDRLYVWALAAGNNLDEALYHERFAAHRLHGEWFERCPEIEAEIARLSSPAPFAAGGAL